MGEAKRRRAYESDLDARGLPRPRDPWCPACGSRNIATLPTTGLRDQFPDINCDWMGCGDCKAVWEPFPEAYARDPVCAEPCDNCAFRPGSPEQQDTERWKKLISDLRPDGSSDNYGMFTGHFYCHKGVSIDMSQGPGNFLFPMKPVIVDGEAARNADDSPVMIADTAKMRTCSGFLRFVWRHNEKTERRMTRRTTSGRLTSAPPDTDGDE